MIDAQVHILTAGKFTPGMFPVKLDLSNFKEDFSSLFFTLTEIWLLYYCKRSWYMEAQYEIEPYLSSCSYMTIHFEDPREAIFFKLSPQFAIFNKFSTKSEYTSIAY